MARFRPIEIEHTEGSDSRFPGELVFGVERSALESAAPGSPLTDYVASIDSANAAYFLTVTPTRDPGRYRPTRAIVTGLIVGDESAYVYSFAAENGVRTTRGELEGGFGLEARRDLPLLTGQEVDALLGTEPVRVIVPELEPAEIDVWPVSREFLENHTELFRPLLRATDAPQFAFTGPTDAHTAVAAAEVTRGVWAVAGPEDVPMMVPARSPFGAIEAYRAELDALRLPSRDAFQAIADEGYTFEGAGRMALGVVDRDTALPHQREVVYVAGPYKAPDAAGVRENIETAELGGCALMRQGYDVVVPHTQSRIDDRGEFDDPRWVSATMNLMERCDAIAVLPGWEHSAGTRAEIERAIELGKPVRPLGAMLDGPVPARLYMSRDSQVSLSDRISRGLSVEADTRSPYRVYESINGELVPFTPKPASMYDRAVATIGRAATDRVAEAARAAYEARSDR